ncbi:MAG: hypothetical protein ACRERU_14660 [Methylococcales bacterium]
MIMAVSYRMEKAGEATIPAGKASPGEVEKKLRLFLQHPNLADRLEPVAHGLKAVFLPPEAGARDGAVSSLTFGPNGHRVPNTISSSGSAAVASDVSVDAAVVSRSEGLQLAVETADQAACPSTGEEAAESALS